MGHTCSGAGFFQCANPNLKHARLSIGLRAAVLRPCQAPMLPTALCTGLPGQGFVAAAGCPFRLDVCTEVLSTAGALV